MNYMGKKSLQTTHSAVAVESWYVSEITQSDPSSAYCTVSVISSLITYKNTTRRAQAFQPRFMTTYFVYLHLYFEWKLTYQLLG